MQRRKFLGLLVTFPFVAKFGLIANANPLPKWSASKSLIEMKSCPYSTIKFEDFMKAVVKEICASTGIPQDMMEGYISQPPIPTLQIEWDYIQSIKSYRKGLTWNE